MTGHNCLKESFSCLGGRKGCWICEMRNLVRQLAARIASCKIPAGKDCWSRDRFVQFLGPSNHCPLEMHKEEDLKSFAHTLKVISSPSLGFLEKENH